MELGLGEAHERFRQELRELFAGADMQVELRRLRATAVGREPDPRPVLRRLGQRGLLAPSWPPEHGGRVRPHTDVALLVEELVRRGVPETLHTLSIQIVGQLLLLVGSAEQRASWLPELAAGRRFATVLYTEEHAGSHLAALTTRAERRPDGSYRLTGRKVYSVRSRLADVGLCAARTGRGGSRYQGLTLFLVPMDADGVAVQELPSLGDERLCAVTLDGVAVGAASVVGEEGQAWGLMTRALALERTGTEHAARCRRWLETALAGASVPGRTPDAGFLEAAGRHGAAAEASRLLCWSVLDELAGGDADGALAAAAKLYASEAAQRAVWWAAEREGLAAALSRADPDAAADGDLDAAYREAPGLTVSAGTSEMLLQTIATSALLTGESGACPRLDPLQRQLQAAARQVLTTAGDAWTALAQLGVLGLALPVAAGGLGLGQAAAAILCEELGRELAPGPYRETLLAAECVALAGPDGAWWGRLGDLATGRLRVGRADVRGAAVPRSDGLRVHGEAPFASWAAAADALLLAMPGGELLLVPAERGGWSVRPLATSTATGLCAMRLDLEAAGGDRLALAPPDRDRALARARLRQASYLVGLCLGALQATVRYARDRRQFDRPLVEHQAVGFRLAGLAARLLGARLLAHHAAWLDDAGRPAGVAVTEALAAAGELALALTRSCMQAHGAFASTRAAPIQRFYRHAPVEAQRLGRPADLWREAGELRLAAARGGA